MRSLAIMLSATCAVFAISANADDSTRDSIDKTKAMLTNSAQRNAAIKGDSQAEAADSKAAAAVGGSAANKDQIYGISADVFDKMATSSGGDSTKMQEQLAKAQSDPQAFFNSMTPEQKSAIESLAKQIQANSGSK